jgi:hypothetical protein
MLLFVFLRFPVHGKAFSLLKCLFPLLPRTTSPALRFFIRRTILSDIRTANMRSKNHKLNRAVQAMLFSMVERGTEGDVVGDNGRLRASDRSAIDSTTSNGEEAMWAVILTKELWQKGTWSVSFVLRKTVDLTIAIGQMLKLFLYYHLVSFTL